MVIAFQVPIGDEVGCGAYDRQSSGQTSHGDQFEPSCVGSHFTPVGSS